MAVAEGQGSLAKFAAANALRASSHADLPAAAGLRRHSDGKVEAAASAAPKPA